MKDYEIEWNFIAEEIQKIHDLILADLEEVCKTEEEILAYDYIITKFLFTTIKEVLKANGINLSDLDELIEKYVKNVVKDVHEKFKKNE